MRFIYNGKNYLPVIRWGAVAVILNNSLKLFPFALLIFPLMVFYFLPEDILADMVNSWMKADMSGKISILKLYPEVTFMLSLASSFLSFMCRGKR
ncbi:hypothetical protein FH461_22620 [Salmonella enterica]|nr:hypothetical protein [Salmonella enterica]